MFDNINVPWLCSLDPSCDLQLSRSLMTMTFYCVINTLSAGVVIHSASTCLIYFYLFNLSFIQFVERILLCIFVHDFLYEL